METLGGKKPVRVERYILSGDPIPLTRIKFGDGRFWDSKKSCKIASKITLQSQHDDKPLFSGPLHLNISFYFPFLYKKKIRQSDELHSVKPDLDSLIKYITEIAEGILYEDDKSIACLIARKYFSTNPRTEIILSELGSEIW